MSIRIDNKNATTVRYNSKLVNQIRLDGRYVWCKSLIYTQGALPTGVTSLTCTRYSTKEPTASTGVISNGDVLYYGDELYWTATAETGYNVSVVHGSSNKLVVTEDVEGVADSGVSAALKTFIITWKYRNAYDTWTTTNETYAYGETPSRANPDTVTSGYERRVPTTWDDLSVVTAARTITMQYQQQYYAIVSPSYCTSNKSTNWYDDGTIITWTASSRYSFNGSSTQDTTTSEINYGGDYTKAPGYIQCDINATRCSANQADEDILPVHTIITWTADTGYSFAEGTTRTATATAEVVLGTTSYGASADYKDIEVSATNCAANIASGYRHLGNTITWTRETGTDYKYSFSDTNVDDDTRTETISTEVASYSKEASYLWYNVTINDGEYCTGSPASGYILENTTITWTTLGEVGDIRYSFSDMGSNVYSTHLGTVTSAGQSIDAPTVYLWYNIVVESTNCTANCSSGWKPAGTIITWTRNAGYAFNETGTATTTTDTVNSARTYSASPEYGYYALTTTNCVRTSGHATGWYTLDTNISTTCTANSDRSFGGENKGDSITLPASGTLNPPCSLTFSPEYFYLNITGTNCTANIESGLYNTTQTIIWTADTNYAFDGNGNPTSAPIITSVPGSYTKSPGYGYFTVNEAPFCTADTESGWYAVTNSKEVKYTTISNDYGFYDGGSNIYAFTYVRAPVPGSASSTGPTHCKAWSSGNSHCSCNNLPSTYNPSTSWSEGGWRALGMTAIWTADAGAGFSSSAYAFDDQGTTTATQIITAAGNYTKSADYGYLGLLKDHCTATENDTGYYPLGTPVVSTVVADSEWAFDSAGTQTTTRTSTVPTNTVAYATYCYATGNGVNCTAADGWYRPNQDYLPWTANTNYAFNKSGTQTSSSAVTGPGEYTKTAGYGRYRLSLTRCAYLSGDDAGWYEVGTEPSTNVVVNGSYYGNYAFDDTGRTSATISAVVPGTATASADYARYSLNLTNCAYLSGENAGWYPLNTTPTTTILADSGWSFGGSERDYIVISNGKVPTTATGSPDYCEITVIGSNCTIEVDGTTRASGWKGYVPNGCTIIWTADSDYAFDNAGTNTYSTTVNGPGTYTKSPDYGYYYLSLTNCSRSSGATEGWKTVGSTQTTYVSANTNYAFDSSGTVSSSCSATVPGTASCAATHAYLSVIATRCYASANGPGWYPVGTSVTTTFTADEDYAFDDSGTLTTTDTHTVPGTNTASANYAYLYITANYCSATTNGAGWYSAGSTITTTFTADSGYAFSSTGASTTTDIVTVPGRNSATCSHAYFGTSLSHCHLRSGSDSVGWYEVGSEVYMAAEADSGYAFDSNGTTVTDFHFYDVPYHFTESANYAYLSIGNTNCYASNNGAGWYAAGSTITTTFTANTNYAFDDQGTLTATDSTTVPGTNYGYAGYGKLRISAEHCYVSANGEGWYPEGDTITTTFTANSSYAFNSSGKQTDTRSTVIPGTASCAASYGYFGTNLSHCHLYEGSDSVGWYALDDEVYFAAEADSGYAFDSSGSDTTGFSYASVPYTYTESATHGYLSINPVRCYRLGGEAAGWKALGGSYTVVYAANSGYAFDSSGTTNKSVTTGVPATNTGIANYGKYTLSLTNCLYYSGNNAGWYEVGTTPSTVVYANPNYSFGGSSRDTTTISNGAVPTTASASPSYYYLEPSNGSHTTVNTSAGWYSGDTYVMWTCDSGYAFDSSGTIRDTRVYRAPSSPSISATHGRYALSLSHCSRSSGDTAGWYTLGSTPSTTVTASSNYAFDSSGTSSITIGGQAVPYTASATPGYGWYGLSLTRCSYSSGAQEGWFEVGTTQYTDIVALSNYAFEDDGRTTTQISATVPETASGNADYAYLTINCTGCWASISNGWYRISSVPFTFTAYAENGYSFSQDPGEEVTQKTYTVNSLPSTVSPVAYWISINYSVSYTAGSLAYGSHSGGSSYYSSSDSLKLISLGTFTAQSTTGYTYALSISISPSTSGAYVTGVSSGAAPSTTWTPTLYWPAKATGAITIIWTIDRTVDSTCTSCPDNLLEGGFCGICKQGKIGPLT